jgi:hypothetical protein
MIVVAIPLKMNPTKSTTISPVRLSAERARTATVEVVDMGASILKERAVLGNSRRLRRAREFVYALRP